MIRYLKNIIFIFLTLSFAFSFAQKKVVDPVLKIYGKDGITRYYKGGILVKIDSNLSYNSNFLKSNKRVGWNKCKDRNSINRRNIFLLKNIHKWCLIFG